MQRRSDIALVSSVILFFSRFGTFPPMSKKPSILTWLLAIFSLGFSLYIIKVYVIDDIIALKFTTTGTILYSSSTLTIIGFNFLCIKTLWFNAAAWEDLMKSIHEFDFSMEGYRTHVEENVLLYYTKIIIFNIGNFTIYILLLLAIKQQFSYTLLICYVYALLSNVQIFVSTLILWDLLCVIYKRYNFLEEKIKEIYQSHNYSDIFWNRRQFKVLFYLLTDMVAKINLLFGQRILMMFILTFFNALSIFQYMFFDFHNNETNVLYKSASVMETAWLLVSIQL